jgi:hypothetical protein
MRMVGAKHGARRPAALLESGEEIARIYLVTTKRIVSAVLEWQCAVDPDRRSDEKSAALTGGFASRVLGNRIEHAGSTGNHTSMAIAMPIPPPMHSAATPFPPPLCFSA